MPSSFVVAGVFIASLNLLQWLGSAMSNWLDPVIIPLILTVGGLQWFYGQRYLRQRNHRMAAFERELAELETRRALAKAPPG
jgi:hypothetical protein